MQPTLSQTLFNKPLFSRRTKLAFCSTFVLGLLVHLYAFTRHLLATADAFTCFAVEEDLPYLGRWLLKTASFLSPELTVPWLLGLVSIFMLACAAVLVVAGLDIRHTGAVVLTSLMLVSLPTMMSTFRYLYTADAYMIALLLSVAAFVVTDRYKYGFAPGIVLLTLSLGIYQAYMPVCIALMAVRALTLLLRGESSTKELLWRALRYAITVLVGLVLYLLITKLVLRFSGQALSGYQGIDQMGQLSLESLWLGFKNCCRDYRQFLLSTPFQLPILALTLVEAFYLLLTRGARPKLQIVAVLLMLCGQPVLFGTVYFIGASDVHSLMQYCQIGFYLLPLALLEEILNRPLPVQSVRKWLVRAVCVLLVALLAFTGVQYGIVTNLRYAEYELVIIRTYTHCLEVKRMVEGCEGYDPSMPVMIDIRSPMTLMRESNQYLIFMEHFLHTEWPDVTAAQSQAVKASPAYDALTAFPDAGCVAIIDGVCVLRTGI